ncbi:hypothetical protein E2562_033996 [Oryza meyeriana var. granulata]|uniref:Uncharacterized protein n=1 Tax=Oryza meyeriana var. granulata TaxID=110450 RepID=A0A6G1ESF4_9ORYZ|nr:hypothetical protein E2562_033996 [Oryza meyeriana var. granulata]
MRRREVSASPDRPADAASPLRLFQRSSSRCSPARSMRCQASFAKETNIPPTTRVDLNDDGNNN